MFGTGTAIGVVVSEQQERKRLFVGVDIARRTIRVGSALLIDSERKRVISSKEHAREGCRSKERVKSHGTVRVKSVAP